MPFAIDPLCRRLEGDDVVTAIGAPVFRYYPYVPGDYLPAGTQPLHITDDPREAARAPVGDALVSDAGLALDALLERIPPATHRTAPQHDLTPHPLGPAADAQSRIARRGIESSERLADGTLASEFHQGPWQRAAATVRIYACNLDLPSITN